MKTTVTIYLVAPGAIEQPTLTVPGGSRVGTTESGAVSVSNDDGVTIAVFPAAHIVGAIVSSSDEGSA